MKKTVLKKAILGLGLLALAAPAYAQPAPTSPTNHFINYIGINFSITAPTSIARNVENTPTNDGSTSANNWGGYFSTPVYNVQVVRTFNDSLGCTTPFTNAAAIAGKWVIIRRGNCEFGAKALAAQQAGAAGVLIANYAAPGVSGNGGGPVGMAAGAVGSSVTIPVFSISDVDGDAIYSQLALNQTVTITITGWQSGFTHDLSILRNGAAGPHANAVPLNQLGANNGNPMAYKFLTGGFIANFGTANESNVVFRNNTTFTPTGGSASTVYTDSVAIGAFNTIDSVKAPVGTKTYDPHPTTTGVYNMNYSLSLANTDQSASDNSQTVSMQVTDSIFCKGRFDLAKGKPVMTNAYRYVSGTTASDFVWGPLYYVADTGYAARKVQFSVSSSTAGDLGNLSPISLYLWRWKDANNDRRIQYSELSQVAIAAKTFSTLDSNRADSVITLNWRNPLSTTIPARLNDTGWYWVAADMPNGTFLGADIRVNQYPRAYTQSKTPGMYDQMYAPGFPDSKPNFSGVAGNTAEPYAYADGNGLDSVTFTQQNVMPNIALHISKARIPRSNAGVATLPAFFNEATFYPNPAQNILNVRVDFTKSADAVWYSIVDGMGHTVSRIKHSNISKESFAIPLNNLAAGQYYLMINADDNLMMKPFTVVSK